MLITYFKDTNLVDGCYEYRNEFTLNENLDFIDATHEQYMAVLQNFGSKIIDGCVHLPLGQTKTDRLVEIKLLKAEEFNLGAGRDITGGFVSTALGEPYEYPTKITDQANLTASITASLLEVSDEWTTPFWCKNAAGVWGYVIHTKAQIQQVGKDCKNFILALQGKKFQLDCELEVANSINECNYLSWNELAEPPELVEEPTDPIQVIIPGYPPEPITPDNELPPIIEIPADSIPPDDGIFSNTDEIPPLPNTNEEIEDTPEEDEEYAQVPPNKAPIEPEEAPEDEEEAS